MDELNQKKAQELTLENTEEVRCACGGTVFVQAVSIRRVSAIISPTGKEEYILAPNGVRCLKCAQEFVKPKIVTA